MKWLHRYLKKRIGCKWLVVLTVFLTFVFTPPYSGGRKYIVINQLTMKSIIINFFGIYKGVVSSDVLAYIAKHINQNSPFLWYVLDNDLYQEKLTERVLWYVDAITANENGTHTVNLSFR